MNQKGTPGHKGNATPAESPKQTLTSLPNAMVRHFPLAPEQIDHLSHSSIATYLRCPRQWAYAYLEGLRRPPGIALIKGSSVDDAATVNLRQKIQSHEDLPTDDVLEVAESAYRKRVDQEGGRSEIVWEGSNYGKALDSTIELTRVHRTFHAPHIQPAEVQLELHRALADGRDVVGYLDFVESDGAVGDVKTGGRRMGQEAADKDQQATVYGWLLGRDIEFTYWRAIDNGTRRSEEVVTTQRDESQRAWFSDQADEVSAAINAGVFPPNPNHPLCNPKWCGFYQLCMSGRKPQI